MRKQRNISQPALLRSGGFEGAGVRKTKGPKTAARAMRRLLNFLRCPWPPSEGQGNLPSKCRGGPLCLRQRRDSFRRKAGTFVVPTVAVAAVRGRSTAVPVTGEEAERKRARSAHRLARRARHEIKASTLAAHFPAPRRARHPSSGGHPGARQQRAGSEAGGRTLMRCPRVRDRTC